MTTVAKGTFDVTVAPLAFENAPEGGGTHFYELTYALPE